MLLKANADVTIPTRNGTTPLMMAKREGYPRIVKLIEQAASAGTPREAATAATVAAIIAIPPESYSHGAISDQRVEEVLRLRGGSAFLVRDVYSGGQRSGSQVCVFNAGRFEYTRLEAVPGGGYLMPGSVDVIKSLCQAVAQALVLLGAGHCSPAAIDQESDYAAPQPLASETYDTVDEEGGFGFDNLPAPPRPLRPANPICSYQSSRGKCSKNKVDRLIIHVNILSS